MTEKEKLDLLKKESERALRKYKGLQGEPKQVDEDFLALLRASHIELQEKRVGKYRIEIDHIEAGKELTVVSRRNWLMMGYKPTIVTYDDVPRKIYKLIKEGQGLLMSDSPQEMFLHYEAYKAAKGSVLVGGLGLGLYATMVANKPGVSEVTVVEIDKDVIKLTKPKHPKISVVHDDITHYIKTSSKTFDYIYIDTYYSTGAMEYIETVLPLKKILKKKYPNTPHSFWAEEEMEAQYDPTKDKVHKTSKSKKND